MAIANKNPLGHRTIVFVDEVHRFNKAQQDGLPSHVEAGHIIFIGATTENPSFEVISLCSPAPKSTSSTLTTPQIATSPPRLHDKEHGFGNDSIEAPDDILFPHRLLRERRCPRAYNTLELASAARA